MLGLSLWVPASAPAAIPIVNSAFVGAVLVAIAGLFSAWQLQREANGLPESERLFSGVVLAWGVLWWLGASWREIERWLPREAQIPAFVALLALTAVGVRRGATAVAMADGANPGAAAAAGAGRDRRVRHRRRPQGGRSPAGARRLPRVAACGRGRRRVAPSIRPPCRDRGGSQGPVARTLARRIALARAATVRARACVGGRTDCLRPWRVERRAVGPRSGARARRRLRVRVRPALAARRTSPRLSGPWRRTGGGGARAVVACGERAR